MNQEQLRELIGKYIHIIFTLHSKKVKATGYFELYGYITTVENKNILFNDNYNHEFIISIAKIKSIEEQTMPRRTEDEYQARLAKEINKAQEIIRKKTQEIADKEPLIILHQ